MEGISLVVLLFGGLPSIIILLSKSKSKAVSLDCPHYLPSSMPLNQTKPNQTVDYLTRTPIRTISSSSSSSSLAGGRLDLKEEDDEEEEGEEEEDAAAAEEEEEEERKLPNGSAGQMDVVKWLEMVLMRLKLSVPSEIQSSAAIGMAKGNDVMILSQTGTGKTLAYLAPILQVLKGQEESIGAGAR